MKTPREILLKRHLAANPRLDLIRQNVVANECRAKNGQPTDENIPLFFGCGLKLWRELILPARGAWSTLAAGWLVIAAVSIATRDAAPVMAKASLPASAVERALQAHQQLRAELLGWAEPIQADRPKGNPLSPRSEQRIETAVV